MQKVRTNTEMLGAMQMGLCYELRQKYKDDENEKQEERKGQKCVKARTRRRVVQRNETFANVIDTH